MLISHKVFGLLVIIVSLKREEPILKGPYPLVEYE
jgi:hypothetical protein